MTAVHPLLQEERDVLNKEHSIIKFLQDEGYFELRHVPGRGMCGLFRFLFTIGLVIGLDPSGYRGRYCYASLSDAKEALREWDGLGDPGGEWIKYKGFGGERSRVPEQF